eukprot:CAMPEP_0177720760 /NCGR_PEP_ID=MMETSP0484_2-20121128/16786_1 /TAXON_ID=354590 /ORGANISM="Rhodomonas lens, Strain RHODO" /LENGTH=148 /DNA_ID=CAMNT_0019233021 /DNA_START=210 /DNA_END=653 /DNA_ORIENTATION=-
MKIGYAVLACLWCASLPAAAEVSWESFEAEIRLGDCPHPHWTLCMCVGGICHSVGDAHTEEMILVTGHVTKQYTTTYDLSHYPKVTWNGLQCHGRLFRTLVRYDCTLAPLALHTLSYDLATCRLVLVAHRERECQIDATLRRVSSDPP